MNNTHQWNNAVTAFICALFVIISAGAVGFSYFSPTETEPFVIVEPQVPLAEFAFEETEVTPEPTPEPTPDPDIPHREAAIAVLSDMTLSEKVWQMLIVTPEQLTGYELVYAAGNTTRLAVEAKPVGGLIYYSQNIQTPQQTAEMLANTKSFSKIAPFFALDEEGGEVTRVAGNPEMNVPAVPAPAETGATGDADNAYYTGSLIGETLAALGFNLNFAPVADVTSGGGSVIGSRSFGGDAALVSDMVSSFVRGLQSKNVGAVLKHFPGIGGADADTHVSPAELPYSADELRAGHFPPFYAGIEAGADMVMVSHVSDIQIDASGTPASLSPAFVTELLRGELGFGGVIITDALNMNAITSQYAAGEEAVLAVKAGCDMLLMPRDVQKAVDAILRAVENGEISEEQINESVLRILTLKARLSIL